VLCVDGTGVSFCLEITWRSADTCRSLLCVGLLSRIDKCECNAHAHVTEDSLVFSYLRIILPCGIFLSVFYFTKFHLTLAGLVKIEPVALKLWGNTQNYLLALGCMLFMIRAHVNSWLNCSYHLRSDIRAICRRNSRYIWGRRRRKNSYKWV
jgi:hypothetical protein